ncbi:hypothetical protein CHU00_18035 [Sphingobacterium cellulitidis]|uniref:FAD/NAD(P)-binding protein n=1 Tax=Sphingobacterium cellulitidis TaxID=1768011 RepID=UPI000B941300|nr:FAD/NAD(P)-binding protein [Sphingobacterium cellulitidis]OYD44240.1 hypothetical protein CHU00_18035 [Sphingobacterium cellulitidis]
MIWNSAYLDPYLSKVPKHIYNQVVSEEDLTSNKSDAIYIAIVGGGPKGFYALDRFISKAIGQNLNKTIKIHWFNHSRDFAAGPNFQPHLPSYLIMNDCIAEVSCWDDLEKPHYIPNRLKLIDWINHNKSAENGPNPSDFCSRELMGLYLMDALHKTLENKPQSIDVSLINGNISDVELLQDKIRLTNSKRKLPFLYESAILCTGHSFSNMEQEDLLASEKNGNIMYLPQTYPVELLDDIPAQVDVAIKGIGLTFMDAVLHLTEGRGGIFYKQDHEYRYLPSGYEPIIYPFSRRNLPMLPRNAFWSGNKYQLKLMTDEWVEILKKRNQPLNFERDILPTYNLETQLAFYTYIHSTKELTDSEIIDFIETFNSSKLFSINALIDPMAYSKVPIESNYHEFIVDLGIYSMKLSDDGELKSPMSAAIAALREGFYQIAELFAHNGFDEESQESFEKHWLGFINHTAFGPPRDSIDKLFCLAREGYVKFIFCEEPRIEINKDSLVIKNSYTEKEFNYLIDARIPKGDLNLKNNKLFDRMRKRGLLQEIVNGNYRNGKIAVDKNGKLISNNHESLIYLYGIPTDGSYLQNDSLSREFNNFANPWCEATFDRIRSQNSFDQGISYNLSFSNVNYINLTPN